MFTKWKKRLSGSDLEYADRETYGQIKCAVGRPAHNKAPKRIRGRLGNFQGMDHKDARQRVPTNRRPRAVAVGWASRPDQQPSGEYPAHQTCDSTKRTQFFWTMFSM